MYCKFCGQYIEDNSSFCSKCGNKLTEVMDEPVQPSEIVLSQEEPTQTITTKSSSPILNKLLFWGTILGLVGFCGFLIIALVGLICYGTIYLFGGYDYTVVLTIICTVFMLIGLGCIITKFVLSLAKKYKLPSMFKRILLICLAVACLGLSIWSFADCANNNSSSGGGGGSGGGLSFYSVYSSCNGSYPWASWGTDYLSFDTNPYDYDSDSSLSRTYASTALAAIRTSNSLFGLPSYLYDEMLETRAVDGRQYYSGSSVNVSWRYHPDSGLEVRYTAK